MASGLKIYEVVKTSKGEPGEDVELWLDRLETAVLVTASNSTSAAQRTELLLPLFLEGAAYAT